MRTTVFAAPLALALVVLSPAASRAAGESHSDTALPGLNGSIAFMCSCEGNYNIFRLGEDGQRLQMSSGGLDHSVVASAGSSCLRS